MDENTNMAGKSFPDDMDSPQWGKAPYSMTPNDVTDIPARNLAEEDIADGADDGIASVAGGHAESTPSVGTGMAMTNVPPQDAPQSFGDWYSTQSGQGSAEGGADGTDVPISGGFGYMPSEPAAVTQPNPVPTPVPSSVRPGLHQSEQRNPYDRQERPKSKKGSHVPWLIGGIAVGAVVVGLGFGVANHLGNAPFVPEHTTTQWEGTSEDKPSTGKTDEGTPASGATDTESLTLASEVAERCLPSVVAIHVSDGMSGGMGSGVIIDGDGHVLTNSHVVKDMTEIVVISGNGEEYSAELLGLDDSSDLAVLNVDWGDTEVTAMEYGDSSQLKVGEWVMTLGSPYGLDQSVSTGIVSALSRNQMMESYGGYRIYANLIQTDAAINLGNSGGALVNSDGHLVGINSMLASNSGSYSAVGFAIPSNYAKRVADQIIAGKEVEHAYIGAQFGNVSRLSMQEEDSPYGTIIDESGQEVQKQDDTPTTGAYVDGVLDDSPAKEAGLQEGDIITKFGDERISSASGIVLAVRAHEIGETVPVTIWRDGKEITIDVTLGSDAGKGLYDNEGNSARQQQPRQQYSPYDGYEQDMEYLERLFEQFGIAN